MYERVNLRYVLGVMPQTYTISNLTDLTAFAKRFLAVLTKETIPTDSVVVALSGDLGAGKTTLVQTLALELGVTEVVQSPTFTILKKYHTTSLRFPELFHMDAYRIEEESELGPLRFAELLDTRESLFCIEWAEKIASALPENVITLTMEASPDETRQIIVTGLLSTL